MGTFTKEQIARAKANGVSLSTLHGRVSSHKWDIERAINTPPTRKFTKSEDGYNQEKLQRIRKQFGEELTFSVYKQIKEFGFSDRDIQRMYELKYHEIYDFLKNHKQKLEEAK